MRVFLDTSVVLAACGSAVGASREVCRIAAERAWPLICTPYVLGEVEQNICKLPPTSAEVWAALRPTLAVMPDVFTVDRPAVFGPAKDRPILFSALAWADVLLTLDRGDFGGLLDGAFYGLRVVKPGTLLQELRAA